MIIEIDSDSDAFQVLHHFVNVSKNRLRSLSLRVEADSDGGARVSCKVGAGMWSAPDYATLIQPDRDVKREEALATARGEQVNADVVSARAAIAALRPDLRTTVMVEAFVDLVALRHDLTSAPEREFLRLAIDVNDITDPA